MAKKTERKRLEKLNDLKALGGPFTDAVEVEDYLKLAVEAKKKEQRMKLELQFAKDSSTMLPQYDPLFKVQVTLPSGKRRDKTPVEFGSALMTFLGSGQERRPHNPGVQLVPGVPTEVGHPMIMMYVCFVY